MAHFIRTPQPIHHAGLGWLSLADTAPVGAPLPSRTPALANGRGRGEAAQPGVKTRTERAIAHSGTGRVVISGRMADVCAEIDRLLALEAQTSWH